MHRLVSMIDPYQPPQSDINAVTPSQKVTGAFYPVIAIAIATFIGGILAGSFLLLNNLELIAKKNLALLVIAVATVVTICTIFFGLFSSFGIVLTNIMVNFSEAVLVLVWCTVQFSDKFDNLEEDGVKQYSLGRAIFYAALTTVAVYLMLLLAYFMFNQLGGSI